MRTALRLVAIAGSAAVGAVVFAAPALADSPTYPASPPATPVAQVLGENISKPVTAVQPVAVKPSQDLPFTGFNAATFATVGGVLVIGGAALTVVGRKRRTAGVS